MEEDQGASPGLRTRLSACTAPSSGPGRSWGGGWGGEARIWMRPSLDLTQLRAQQGSWSSISPTEPRTGAPGRTLTSSRATLGYTLPHHGPHGRPPPRLPLWQDYRWASAASSPRREDLRALEKRVPGSLYLLLLACPPAPSPGAPLPCMASVRLPGMGLGTPLPAAWPSTMTDAASGGLGTAGGRVKATRPFKVIDDDKGILRLREAVGDQRQQEGAAATGRNSLANAANYRKLAAVTAITMKGSLAPSKRRGGAPDSGPCRTGAGF